ncbi:MAG: cytochrome b [Albidovulum sp.]|nr:cytochrome b [Albidovulum sp.]
MAKNRGAEYGRASKLLHWILAICMIALVWLGWWMVGLDYYHAWSMRALELHRSIGMAVFALAAVFAIWKFISPSPALQAELRPWERAAARATHILLICAMFVIPVSGYLLSTSSGSGFEMFGLIQIPAVAAVTEPVRDLAESIHYFTSYGLLALVAIHAGAALKHQFFDGHGTLKRML